jgi:hypothetical protein
MKIGIEERSESVQECRLAAETTRIGEALEFLFSLRVSIDECFQDPPPA